MTREGRKIHTTTLHARLVALLFILSTTCEWAAFAPTPIRRAALYFLLRGERAAHSLVYWAYRDCGAVFSWGLPEGIRGDTSPEAAMSLSAWFRTLAIALRDLPRRALIEKHRHTTSLSDCLQGAEMLAWPLARCTTGAWPSPTASPAPDTS